MLRRSKRTGNYYGPNRQYSMETVEMSVDDYRKKPKWLQKELRGFKAAVDFRKQPVPLDPYFIGLWLGDGSRHKPVITSGDPEIVDYYRIYAAAHGLKLREEPGIGCSQWYFTRGARLGPSTNPVTGALRRLNLFECAEKFIPEVYKFNDTATRLQVLAGVIDSDGNVSSCARKRITASFTEKQLALDVVWLARSLGFQASVVPKIAHLKSRDYRVTAYVISISGKCAVIPTKVPRKKPKDSIRSGSTKIKVTSLGVGDYFGFELSGDGQFLLGDFTVTHNTAIFAAIAAMIKHRMPSARILYVASTERLVVQGFKDMQGFLPGWDITQAGGNTRKRKKNEPKDAPDPRMQGKDMVVATMAMMARNMRALFAQGFFKSITVLLVDEVQHAPADTWDKVIRLTPAMFRFGASDTIKDEREEDICEFLAIRGLLGPLRAEVAVTPLIETGRVAKPYIYLIDPPGSDGLYEHVPFQAEPNTPAWCYIDGSWIKGTFKHPAKDSPLLDKHGRPLLDKKTGEPIEPPNLTGYHTIDLPDRGEMDVESRWCLLNRVYDVAIVRNKERNKLIGEWTDYFAQKLGYPTLVVATRTLHVLILEDLLRRRGNDVEVLTGESTSKQRDLIFKWLVEKEGRVLISPLVKEGVSIPKLRGGVVADVVTSPDLARQIIGRFIRQKLIENEAHVAWFYDRWYKSARLGCQELFTELERIRGYSYYWPCYTPGVPAMLYKAADFT